MTTNEARSQAIEAYAAHVGGLDYDGNERTLLIIGYAAGYDAVRSPEAFASECDHEFTDHCVRCGMDAHEWFGTPR